jgi:hypothetical protein
MTKIPHMEIEAETTTRRVSLVATEVSGIGESAPDCDVRHQRWLIVLDIFNRFVMVPQFITLYDTTLGIILNSEVRGPFESA